ncbi:MAG: GTP-binding protein, partial [Gammaproteobacteria bacterium]
FDSIHSANYYNSLLKAIALADVVLLAVSKDKYADQTVWNILGLIESLRQPMVIVLNKIAPENCSAVIQSFREKWQSSRSDPMPPIVAVPFLPKGIDAQNAAKEHGQLIAYLEKAQSCIDRGRHRANSALLLQQHWPAWTEAVRQEQNLRSEWNRIVDNATDEAIEIYQRDYLNHPQHFETFNRALAELLILLEIPGVAPVLAKTRQILTWPIRQILGFHRSRKFGQEPPKSQEMQILERMFEHFMIQLFGSVLTKRGESGDHQNWWDEISVLLKPAQEHLSQSYTRALKTYLTDFNREIEAAAHRLYEKLEHQPATLNSLRATRFITDAAGVATALHTGGIGIQDLVLTPAFFALTSFLTESALGQYMRRVEAELKQKQLSAVSTRLFHEALTQELKNLPRSMTPENKFNISVDSLEDAEKQLHAV